MSATVTSPALDPTSHRNCRSSHFKTQEQDVGAVMAAFRTAPPTIAKLAIKAAAINSRKVNNISQSRLMDQPIALPLRVHLLRLRQRDAAKAFSADLPPTAKVLLIRQIHLPVALTDAVSCGLMKI